MLITLANGRVYTLQELSTLELIAAWEAPTTSPEQKRLICAEVIRRSKEQHAK